MNRKNPPLKFQKAWSWPEGLEAFLRMLLVSPSLHVCCGESELGDVKVDLYVERRDVVKADFFVLPFKSGAFASVLIDPPWHLPYDKRPQMAKELARVLRPGGILIFNCPWRINLRILRLEEVYWADTKAWRNIPVVQIYRKQPTMADYDEVLVLQQTQPQPQT
jgi:SAM-dependent methyltransferase